MTCIIYTYPPGTPLPTKEDCEQWLLDNGLMAEKMTVDKWILMNESLLPIQVDEKQSEWKRLEEMYAGLGGFARLQHDIEELRQRKATLPFSVSRREERRFRLLKKLAQRKCE